MNTTDCIFCKIITGDIPAEKVYEDDTTLAFLDIKPINPGHTLIIPKEHHENLFDIPNETAEKIIVTVKKIAEGIKTGLGIENINIGMNNGSIAGQMVFHAHMHVMPRHENDGYEMWHGKEYESGEASDIANKIKNAL